MAKKKKNIERNIVKKEETKRLKERLENFMVMAVSLVLVYAVVFAVLYNYMGSLVNGTRTVCLALRWISIAGVAVAAVWGAVKKDSRAFKWSAFFAANAVLWFFFLRFGQYKTVLISGLAYCYYALLIFFLASLAYYFLALYKRWEKKGIRRCYFILLCIVVLTYLISAVVFMYLNGNITGYTH